MGDSSQPDSKISSKHLQVIAMMAKSSGIERKSNTVGSDVKDMLHEALGEGVGDSQGKFDFLKEEDSTLEQIEKEMAGQLSFNFEVPKDMKGLQEMMKKMEKEHGAAEGELPQGIEEEDMEDEAQDSAQSPNAKSPDPQPPESDSPGTERTEAQKVLDSLLKPGEGQPETETERGITENMAREIEAIEKEMTVQHEADDPQIVERVRKQKAEYDDWNKALKNRDIWGKGE